MWPGFGTNWGTAAKGLWRGIGQTGQGAILGAVAGGIGGALSDDRSVLGGALMGAGLNAAMFRYGSAGFAAMRGAGIRQGPGRSMLGTIGYRYGNLGQRFAAGVRMQARWDLKGARTLTSRAANSIRGIYTGWGRGSFPAA